MVSLALPHALLAVLTETEISEWRDAATEDQPPVHVKSNPKGCWHKVLANKQRTACGQVMGAYATRDEKYDGSEICGECFTAYERGLNDEAKARNPNNHVIVDWKRDRQADEIPFERLIEEGREDLERRGLLDGPEEKRARTHSTVVGITPIKTSEEEPK